MLKGKLLELWDRIGEAIPYTILYSKNKRSVLPRWAIEKFRIVLWKGVIVIARKVDNV